MFDAVSVIRKKRLRAGPHSEEELRWWIQSYTTGDQQVADYQMAAWLMAVCLNGLSAEETAALTNCLVESGVRLEWPADIKTVDKHSTGGVGDKVSLLLAPLVASFGVRVPMMAGRGLGHTGGTIDKLESIPGFRCELTVAEFQEAVLNTGCVIAAPGSELCPADKKLYALRDVTDTVTSIPLQTASIMSKKIAENPNSLVLGVLRKKERPKPFSQGSHVRLSTSFFLLRTQTSSTVQEPSRRMHIRLLNLPSPSSPREKPTTWRLPQPFSRAWTNRSGAASATGSKCANASTSWTMPEPRVNSPET
jgi:hypothetical protein